MSQPDYYQLLGVSADAPVAELEAAYRRITALFGSEANLERVTNTPQSTIVSRPGETLAARQIILLIGWTEGLA